FPVYGTRTQWNGQTLNVALRDNGTDKDALIEWGNIGGLMKFRYITNPSSSTGFRNIQLFNSDGQVYVGGNDFTTIAPLSSPTFYAEAYAGAGNLFSGTAIYGKASFGRFEQIGIFGDGSAGTGNGRTRAVYGIAPTGDYAGYSDGDSYLNGNAFYTGSLIFVSDKRLKKDIVKETSALNKLMLLNAYTYNMQTPEKSGLNLAKKLQHGFIAQEVEEVFPELVNEVSNLNEAKEKQTFKGVNYVALIPILTRAIQEQQVQIDELKKQLANKTNEVIVVSESSNAATEKIKANSFMLAQNVPNPFTSSTTIKYSIPEKNTAMVAVFDLNGKMLLQFPNLRGASQVTINGSSLQAGMYLYSLIVNGQEIITKKMVLTK
ncbi:MAG: tail fiber domain-containing protein, partial [Chitinophagaceae bacterium]|nr:tail fiber domain-containing protein [Chitinophagaceae bacterium]